MDTSVLLFTAGLSFIIAVGLAAFPTLQQRVLGSGALAEGGRSTTVGRERRRARHALVMGQVALALVLIVGAVLLVQSYRRLQKVDPGIDPLGTLALQIYLPPQVRYNGADSMWRFYGPALENIRRLPGVTHAGLATALPFTDTYGCTVQGFEDSDVFERIRGRLGGLCADMVEASPGYFESLRIPVLAGRVFTTADIDQPERGVVVVSKTFAERFWGHENPLGRGVIPFNRAGGRSYRVIGVVGDVHPETLDDKPASAVYYPMRPIPGQAQWWPSSVYITVRTGLADPEGLLPAIRTAVAAVDPAIPIANALDMTTIVANSMSRLSFMLTLIAIAATVALLLAAVGLYGVISYTVAQRTNEIGVRIALGAAPAQVERFVVNGALRLMGMGVVAGVAVALLVTRVLRSLLFGVSATDPVSFVAGAVLLSIVALAAAWVPARRAARVDPMVALRSE
jgi:putative ABC transport system permease protein